MYWQTFGVVIIDNFAKKYATRSFTLRGFAKKENIQIIRDYYGSGCKGGSRSHSEFVFVKSSKNNPKPVLIFWSSIGLPCVFCLYIHF